MPLVQELLYDIMTESGNIIVEGQKPLETKVNQYTRQILHQLRSPTNKTQRKATPITYEAYSEELRRLREGTSSGPSIVIPSMIKTDIMDPELEEIGWRMVNFSW